MDLSAQVNELLLTHSAVSIDLPRPELIKEAVSRKEAFVSQNGALSTWTPPESTGRSPKDTYMVRRKESEAAIDWNSPNNIPMSPDCFDLLFKEAIATLAEKDQLYVTHRALSADAAYALSVKIVTHKAITTLFADNMFRPVPADLQQSLFSDIPFVLLVVPYDKLPAQKYKGSLRQLEKGETSDMAIAMDFDRKLGVVYGSAYCGSVKKLMFTVMNYLLPGLGILPLHCSATENKNGDMTLYLGLSGTGKTTLSADPNRALLGDDEHGWSDTGIANFENGCYAKLINLKKEKEPEIYNAITHVAHYLEHGAIVENAMIYPNGEFDFSDERLTPNSRGSYPLTFLTNIKASSTGGHPKTIIFLTADANGVLPPVAKLSETQAMLWFLMGYTSKLAGTETGIIEPQTTFSRFFGGPFMPRNPDVYAQMLGEKMKQHQTEIFLVNTGWSGGPYGVGKRMDINLTRSIIDAVLKGALRDVAFVEDPLFHLLIPATCQGVPSELLDPKTTWPDKAAYDQRARKLAREFSGYFDKTYSGKGLSPSIVAQCPGK